MNCEQMMALAEIAVLAKAMATLFWALGGAALLVVVLTMRP